MPRRIATFNEVVYCFLNHYHFTWFTAKNSVSPSARTKKVGYFRSWFDPFSRMQRTTFS